MFNKNYIIMKTLRLFVTITAMTISIIACSPNHDEVSPNPETEQNEAFEVKSDHGTPSKKGDDR